MNPYGRTSVATTVVAIVATLALLSHPLFAQPPQPPAAAPLAFEAASIRPSGPQSIRGSAGGPGSGAPTLYQFDSATLLDLIAAAWKVDYFQISSAAPLDRNRFDLTARLPVGTTKEQFRLMLRNLLAERFGLKIHIESREFPGYELAIAKSGLKLKEAAAPPAAPASDTGTPRPVAIRPTLRSENSFQGGVAITRLVVVLEPISAVARFLPRPDNLPVVDQTGLTGNYTFTLDYIPDSISATPDAAPSALPDIFTALQDQLGLQLVRKKLPFDVVVVDTFSTLPTEN
jgi:uncharacterized protein (TIGR03435 family)